ncbi:MAG: hypothetical protein IKP36_05180 [Bacteroidaceae bacterium]|nr:hypothetical protein [Prevotella sp.]MBR6031339.1 hypothetical protein [Bacteroidaceae bacterium]
MQNFKLKKETIEAIADFLNSTEIFDEYTSVEDAEFEQDDTLICVDYEVYATWIEDKFVHTEVSWPNVEDFSRWEISSVTLNKVIAYDEDGEELGISSEDFKEIEKKLAA